MIVAVLGTSDAVIVIIIVRIVVIVTVHLSHDLMQIFVYLFLLLDWHQLGLQFE